MQGLTELGELFIQILKQPLGPVQFLGIPLRELDRFRVFPWGLVDHALRVLSVVGFAVGKSLHGGSYPLSLEVMWSPENPDDTLTEDELIAEYPDLSAL